MRTELQTPRRPDAKGRHSAAMVWLAVALATLPRPSVAQRLPERFGPPLTSERFVTSLAGPGASAGAAAIRRPFRGAAAIAPERGDSGLTVGLFASEVVGGSVGAALGFYAGAAAGGRSCDVVGSCGGEDPGLGRAILGAFVGAWLGTAAGSHFGGGLAGGPTGSFASRLGAAAGGLLAATGLAALLQADFDRPATWIPVPVAAAAVAALAVRRR